MIDAIFIQTCTKEFKNKRLFEFLKNLSKCILNKRDIYIFCDSEISLNENSKYLNLLRKFIKNKNLNTCALSLVLINDNIQNINKVSHIFSFMMNYKVNDYKKILLLETDCYFSSINFLNILEKEEAHFKNKHYWILGSQYYGKQFFKNGLNNTFLKSHLNGVAVYNRTPEFINFFNKIFISDYGIRSHINHDFLLYFYFKVLGCFYDKCIDSESILNISSNLDKDLNPKNLKKNAVIIHKKLF